MPTFPLGQANDDRIHFNPATQSWERRSDDGGGEIEFSEDTVQDLKALTTADDVQVGSLGIVLATGNIYRAIDATAVGSTWSPASGWFNLKDFGAVGDNSADDTAVVQAWMAEMAAFIIAFGGGAAGYVDPGDYKITAQVNGISNVLIRGAGRLVSRFRASNAAGFSIFNFTNKLNVVLESFGVEGDGQSLAGGIGIEFDNVGQSIVRDLDVRTVERGIVFGNGSEDCRAEECWAVQTTTAFEASDSSNDSHFVLCRSVNALTQHLLLDGVSQCTGQQCSFQLAGTSVGVTFAATNNDNIACGVYATRTEGPAGTVGYNFPATANNISYPTIQDPYWTGGLTPVTNHANAIDPRIINRSRYWEPIIQQDPYLVNPGDLTAKLKWHNVGPAGATTEPECLDPRQHNQNTGVTAAPVVLRRNIVSMTCGSSQGFTAATIHYISWIDNLGSGSLASARAQKRMPRAGRVIAATVICNGNLGSTQVDVVVNDTPVVSDTQNVGAGRGNGATFELSNDPADQHFAKDDFMTIGITPTNGPAAAVVVELLVEYDMRTTNL